MNARRGEGRTHIPPLRLDFDGKDEGPPPTCGKVFSLSRPEWPALLLSLVLTAATEASGLAARSFAAEAYNTAIDPELPPARMHDVVRNQMVLVFTLHVISVVAAFVKGCIIGLAGERVVARLAQPPCAPSSAGSCLLRPAQERRAGVAPWVGHGGRQDGDDRLAARLYRWPGQGGGGDGSDVLHMVKLTSVILSVAFGLLGICVPFGKWIAKISKRYQDALGKAQTRSTEALGSMRTVRAFVAEQPEATRCEDVIASPTLTSAGGPPRKRHLPTRRCGDRRKRF